MTLCVLNPHENGFSTQTYENYQIYENLQILTIPISLENENENSLE